MKVSIVAILLSTAFSIASPLERRFVWGKHKGPVPPPKDIYGPFAIQIIRSESFQWKYVHLNADGTTSVSDTPQKIFSLNEKTRRLTTDTGLVLDVAFNSDQPMLYHNAVLDKKEAGLPLLAPIQFKKESETWSVNTYFTSSLIFELEIVKGEYRGDGRFFVCKQGSGHVVKYDKLGGIGKTDPDCQPCAITVPDDD